MIAYLTTFAITIALAFLVPVADKKSFGLGVFLMVLSMLPLCFLAGMRSWRVGTDVMIYGINDFLASQGESLFEWSSHVSNGALFNFVTWIIARFTHSIPVEFFVFQALAVAPSFVAFYRFDKSHAWVAIAIYCFIFFGYSLNLMKQMIAVGFILLSYGSIRKRRILPFLLCVVIAFGFHITAIVGLVLYPLLVPLRHYTRKGVRVKRIFQFAVIAIALLGALFGRYLLPLLAKIKPTYQDQLDMMTQSVSSPLAFFSDPTYLLLAIGMIVLVFFGIMITMRHYRTVSEYARQERLEAGDELVSLALVVVLGCVTCLLVLTSPQLYRMAFYFLWFAPVLILAVIPRIPEGALRIGFVAILIVLSIVASYVIFIVGGSCEVYPYQFMP